MSVYVRGLRPAEDDEDVNDDVDDDDYDDEHDARHRLYAVQLGRRVDRVTYTAKQTA